MRLFAPSVLLLAAALGCAPPPPADTAAAAKTAIDAANAQWPHLTSTGHSDSIADFYAANAVVMPPNMATVRGREAIRAFFATMNPLTPTLTLHADSVWGTGTSAVELGRWHWTWAAGKMPPGAPPADSGKYIVRWVNENGRWLMAQDIWNSDLPLPTTAAAPAPSRH